MIRNDFLRHLTSRNALNRRHLIHHVAHDALDDGAQSACPRLVRKCFLGNEVQCILLERQTYTVHIQKSLELLDKCIFRLREDTHHRRFIQRTEGDNDGQATNKFGNEPVLHQILRDHLAERFADGDTLLGSHLGAEPHLLLPKTGLNDFLDPVECAAADEKDIRRIDLQKLLLWVLAPALRRYGRRCPLKDLEQPLLYAFA